MARLSDHARPILMLHAVLWFYREGARAAQLACRVLIGEQALLPERLGDGQIFQALHADHPFTLLVIIEVMQRYACQVPPAVWTRVTPDRTVQQGGSKQLTRQMTGKSRRPAAAAQSYIWYVH